MVAWPRSDVLMQCRALAQLAPVGVLNSVWVLAALAENESTLGANCGPRHEPAWDVGGEYASEPIQAQLLEKYPYDAACSYGPLQIMFYNCSGYTPTELNTDLPLVMAASIGYLSRQVKRWNITSLQGVGEMWNWGHPDRPLEKIPLGVQNYCKKLAGNYLLAAQWLNQ